MIKLIVGLGNPGQQYEQTRHNAGFVFLDYLISKYGGAWQGSGQFQGEIANVVVAANKLVLLKPMTFMNRSGLSVGNLLRYYKIKPEELLVVHDELELPEGVIKMKRDGGHAGHNGLRDIIAHVDSRDFYRLRVGIGRPAAGSNIADYVLSKPSQEGCASIEKAVKIVAEKVELLIGGNVSAVNELGINNK